MFDSNPKAATVLDIHELVPASNDDAAAVAKALDGAVGAVSTANFTLGRTAERPSGMAWHALRLRVGGHDLSLYVTGDVVKAGFAAHGYQDDPAGLSPLTRQHAVRHLLAPVLRPLAAATSTEIEVDDCVPMKETPPFDTCASWSVDSSHSALAGLVLCLPVTPELVTLARPFARNTDAEMDAGPDLRAVPQRVACRSAQFAMPATSLGALCVGDVLSLGGWTPKSACHEIWLNGARVAHGRYGDKGLILETQMRCNTGGANATEGDKNMQSEDDVRMDDRPDVTDENGKDAPGDAPEGPTFADDATQLAEVPIALSIELDRAIISLAEVQALRAGAKIPFSEEPPKAVRLLANGQPIAEGVLVRLEDRIGFQIERMA